MQYSEGARGKRIKLIFDYARQPASISFIEAMSFMGIKQIFTSYNNPKGNADVEMVFRTLKKEIFWTKEYESQSPLEKAIVD